MRLTVSWWQKKRNQEHNAFLLFYDYGLVKEIDENRAFQLFKLMK